MVVSEAAGDNVKVTTDGTDKDGKPTHIEWTGKFDGKDYPVTGDPNSDMRSYKRLAGDKALEVTVKKDGEVTITAQRVVSSDGKSCTVTAKGKSFTNVAVYDKQ